MNLARRRSSEWTELRWDDFSSRFYKVTFRLAGVAIGSHQTRADRSFAGHVGQLTHESDPSGGYLTYILAVDTEGLW